MQSVKSRDKFRTEHVKSNPGQKRRYRHADQVNLLVAAECTVLLRLISPIHVENAVVEGGAGRDKEQDWQPVDEKGSLEEGRSLWVALDNGQDVNEVEKANGAQNCNSVKFDKVWDDCFVDQIFVTCRGAIVPTTTTLAWMICVLALICCHFKI